MNTRLVCFGHDEMLLVTRKLILDKLTRVEVVSNFDALTLLVGNGSLDLVVLCHTLKPEERERAIKLLAQRSPSTKIVCLVPVTDTLYGDIPEHVCTATSGSAENLHRTVKKLLGLSSVPVAVQLLP